MTASTQETAVVSVRDARIELGGRTILHDVNLTVRAGEVVALLGGNGSGKSTLVRAMLGLVPLEAGEVRLFGTPVERFRGWHRIGYVPQRSTVVSGVPVTVRELVSTGRLAHTRPFRPMSRTDRAAIDAAIDLVGLSNRAHDMVSLLSGGQQQRALIARAAAGRPELMVLDEPMAGVDVHSQEMFARALRVFVARGNTLLLVLHELGPLVGLINRAVFLRDQRIVHDGPLPVPVHLQVAAGYEHPHLPAERVEGWWSG